MTKITFIEKSEAEEKYAIGDWFLTRYGLCVLAQTDSGLCQMVGVSEGDANRHTETIDWTTFGYNSIPKEVIDGLFDGEEWQKVSVEIIVNKSI